MGLKISLDSNVFIAVMNKEANSSACTVIFDLIEEKKLIPLVSTIVIAEVLVGFDLVKNVTGKSKFLKKLQIFYEIIDVSLEIAQIGAEIRSKTSLKLPDALIYATALQGKANCLITNDFPVRKLNEIKVYTPDEFVSNFLKNNKKSF